MFTKIIVGVDARDGGRDALALADALARLSGGVRQPLGGGGRGVG